MRVVNKPPRLQSWIPPSFVWTAATDVFYIEVSIHDPDLVEFISTGVREVTVSGTKKTAHTFAAMIGEDSLAGQLHEGVWGSRLRPVGPQAKSGTTVPAHCHGVFLLPDEKRVCVMIGRGEPNGRGAWISTELKTKADSLLRDHQAKVAEFDNEIERKKQGNEEFCNRLPEPHKARIEQLGEVYLAMESRQRPVLTAVGLVSLFPRAVSFAVQRARNADKIARSAVVASTLPPSRDGTYVGILPHHGGRRAQGIISWVPHDGLPSYPELRWAVQRRLPSALSKPRTRNFSRPTFDSGTELNSSVLNGFDLASSDVYQALGDMQLDQSDFRSRVDEIQTDIKSHGYEAIAWFQPYHIWTEETWGIYFDSIKLDDFAYSLLDQLSSQSVRASHGLAAFLAFGLTYAHELFHARVEAALSWLEINSLQPKHLRYTERVYQVLRETPDWLEEALANWSALDWFKSDTVQSTIRKQRTDPDSLERVIKWSMDISPPGYRDWRRGQQSATWSTFATQLSTGKPKLASPGIALPVKSTLTGPLPYDFQPSDIPLRFVGPGVIADRLKSHPATFNVPSRRELEKALKYFKHSLDAAGGKGGHQKWTGPDRRAFILPTRDPVSPGVFKTLLHHLGIDKATYVREVRPNL